MMLNSYLIAGLVLLTLGAFIRRYLGERARALLLPEEKLILLDSFSRLRVFGALPLLPILFPMLGIGYLPSRLVWSAYWLSWLLIAVYLVFLHVYIYRRMKKLGINASYLVASRRARWFLYGGLAAFFALNTAGILLAR